MASSAPFRPAREIAITARRIACHDPANYDTTATTPSTVDSGQQDLPSQGDLLDSHPGQPPWWPAFTKAMAGAAAAGAVIFLAGLHLLGVTVTAAAAATWGLARIAAFYDNDLP